MLPRAPPEGPETRPMAPCRPESWDIDKSSTALRRKCAMAKVRRAGDLTLPAAPIHKIGYVRILMTQHVVVRYAPMRGTHAPPSGPLEASEGPPRGESPREGSLVRSPGVAGPPDAVCADGLWCGSSGVEESGAGGGSRPQK